MTNAPQIMSITEMEGDSQAGGTTAHRPHLQVGSPCPGLTYGTSQPALAKGVVQEHLPREGSCLMPPWLLPGPLGGVPMSSTTWTLSHRPLHLPSHAPPPHLPHSYQGCSQKEHHSTGGSSATRVVGHDPSQDAACNKASWTHRPAAPLPHHS